MQHRNSELANCLAGSATANCAAPVHPQRESVGRPHCCAGPNRSVRIAHAPRAVRAWAPCAARYAAMRRKPSRFNGRAVGPILTCSST
eukprot:6181984-Pleurochrysis_carterae.AAC.3